MNTAEALLDSLDDVIADHGASGVTLRRVGQTAGLSHTAAAHCYNDKQGLFTAYITRAWNRVADRLEALTDLDPTAALVAAADAYASFALEESSAFKVMSRLELANVDTPELWAAREPGFFILLGFIEAKQAAGWAQSAEALDLLATMWAMVHGFVDLWIGGPLWAPYDGQELRPTLERLVVELLDSLGASAPSK